MIFIIRNFWQACRENWPEFFIFLAIVATISNGLMIALAQSFDSRLTGPIFWITVALVLYLLWCAKTHMKEE